MLKKMQIRDTIRSSTAAFSYLSGAAWVRKTILRSRAPLVRVLVIHHVRNQDAFTLMIRHITSKYNVISWREYEIGKLSAKKVNLLLTMDDGYESWYTAALPVLEKYNCPVVWFVSSGYLDTSGDRKKSDEFARNRLLLSKEAVPLQENMLAEAAKNPLVTIGGHTKSHLAVDTLGLEDFRVDIATDKTRLEGITGKKIHLFAYPFGFKKYDKRIEETIESVGYSHAFTTCSDFIRPEHSKYNLPRSNHGTVTSFWLDVWIQGGFDLIQRLERWLAAKSK